MKDYYRILGIGRNASDDEIKKAFRKLAHQYHPDKAHGSEAKFKEVNEAYQVLSDRARRANYDRFGSAEGPSFGGGPFRGAWGGAWDVPGGGFPFGAQGNEADLGDLDDIFQTIFGGMGVRAPRPTYRKGADLETVKEISLEDAFRGSVASFGLTAFIRCATCRGQGGDPSAGLKTCGMCGGGGQVREERRTFFGSFSQVKACSRCSGTGQVPEKTCGACDGKGRVRGRRDVRVEILPGVHDNQLIRVKSMGDAGERGTTEGDLFVRVRVRSHPTFERRGDDLVIRRELKLYDLLLGRKTEIPTIEGKKLSVEIPAHVDLKQPLRVRGEGMPRLGSGGRGDLLVDFIIKAPKKLSDKARKALEDIEGIQ